MCDVQLIKTATGTWFAKNSDREASEPQLVVRLPAVRGDQTQVLQSTYLKIAQTPDRYGVLLSKPAWIWGAEMGANDQGVIVGNTAIFTKLAGKKPGLIGMDLLRLGLERGGSASEAREVIIAHLEQYGQGGPCGYRNKKFHYDNSFLIADHREAFVLETAGHYWAWKRIDTTWTISNCMTLADDYDAVAPDATDFARQQGWLRNDRVLSFKDAFETRLMPVLSGARRRLQLSHMCIAETSRDKTVDLATMAAHLRRHRFAHRHHNDDVCMHAGGRWTRPSQSTGAMLSHLTGDPSKARHFFTGTSSTCRSVFRPAGFDEHGGVLSDPATAPAQSRWHQYESVQRRMALGLLDPAEWIVARDALEAQLFADQVQHATRRALDQQADALQQQWIARAQKVPWQYRLWQSEHRFWRRLNRLDGIA